MGFPDPQKTQPFTRRWQNGRSPLLAILIGINVAVFVLQLAEHFAGVSFLERYGALSPEGIREGYFWQFFTYMFLHSVDNPLHIVANMLTLYFAGREVEAIVGPKHFLAIFFGGGFLGGLLTVVLQGESLIGASGGVFAVLIAFTTLIPETELTLLLFFILPVRMKAKYLAWGLVSFSALAIIFNLLPAWGHLAHLGGCALGWVYIKQLGFGNPLRIQQYMFQRRQRQERLLRMTPEQYISEEIDPLLDKISRHGIHSLTRAERRILEKGRDKIASRTSRTIH